MLFFAVFFLSQWRGKILPFSDFPYPRHMSLTSNWVNLARFFLQYHDRLQILWYSIQREAKTHSKILNSTHSYVLSLIWFLLPINSFSFEIFQSFDWNIASEKLLIGSKNQIKLKQMNASNLKFLNEFLLLFELNIEELKCQG